MSLPFTTIAPRTLVPVHLSPAILPAWAGRLVRGASVRELDWNIEHASGRIEETASFSVLSARLSRAGDLEPALLTQRTTLLYQAIQHELHAGPTRHPVRIWNYLPDIHSPNEDGTDRYMTFNAGRFAAFEKWFAGQEDLGRFLPSASAVGHHGQ